MEPQINFGENAPKNSSGRQMIYGRHSGLAAKGFLGFSGAIVLLIIIIIAGIFFVYPALTPNAIHGDFMDMTIIPQKDGSVKLWILTDGSFHPSGSLSPGIYSTGRQCYFCKTWTYVYDPVNEKILRKTKTERKDIITATDMVYYKGKVWELTHGYGENDPKVEAYDSETGELVMDTKKFTAKFPELSAGIAEVKYSGGDRTIILKTKDGKDQLTYSINEDKLYKSPKDYYDEQEKSTEPGSILVLGAEATKTPGKKLYRVNGPKGFLYPSRSNMDTWAINDTSMDFFQGYAKGELLGEKVYLEGIIYYQDDNCALIVHLDRLGEIANRILTCVDMKSGKERWSVQQDDMFVKMKIDENKDTFSSLFFSKGKISLGHVGSQVVLGYTGKGMMGFDLNTGKKLWTLDI